MPRVALRILFVLTLLSCSSRKSEIAATETFALGPVEFEQKIKDAPDAVVLDVRTAEEFQEGNLLNATNIDFNNPKFQTIIDQQDKEKPYFVYCAKGARSSKAADLMRSLGFKKVYHLEGGINAWKGAGLTVSVP